MIAAPALSTASAPPTRRELLLAAVAAVSLLFAFLPTSAPRPGMLPVSQRLARERPALRVLPAGHTFTAAGRTVVVTGSSRGIGKGIAMVFAEAGANVIINSRHLDEAEATAAELVAAGGEASAFAGDVSSEADMQALMATAVERYGGLDVVCANAGIIPDETMEGVSVAEWDRAFEINVRGSFLAVKTALPYLKQSSAGRVVLTSSITGPITVTPPCGSNPGVAEGSASTRHSHVRARASPRDRASRAGATTAPPRRRSWASCARPRWSSRPSA